ncbi:MAG TPA: SCO family protein [Ramlibacter sp.]|nr:SCO family protein [Ramlibacter sp.]
MIARLFGALLALALVLGMDFAVAANRWGADYFPNVPLVTQDGRTVRFYDDLLKGKSVVVNLIYTQCSSECPLETAKLVQVQRLLGGRVGKDVFFYSISIDPFDTPELLKAYAEKFGVGPGWLFLTGKEADIALIGKKLGLSSLSDLADRDGHQPSLMIGNEPAGQWMRNSAVDNPRFLATKIGMFLGSGNMPVTEPAKSYALARPIEDLDPGGHLFSLRCSACHTIGEGDAVGPDLLGVTGRRDRAWLERYLAQPDKMLAERDPIVKALFARYRAVRMPNLHLGQGDVAALLSYLEARSNAAQQRERKGAVLAR